MPAGGNLSITTANIVISSDDPRAADLKPGAFVNVSSTDTGHGMDAVTRDRIFEPFFTTREMGRGSGQEALEIYRREQAAIDLVILDMIMPAMRGGRTFDALKAIDPDIRVLLSSGYSLNGQASDILQRGCRGFIQKPFDLGALSHKLREILDA